jgi:hypothetical protein
MFIHSHKAETQIGFRKNLILAYLGHRYNFQVCEAHLLAVEDKPLPEFIVGKITQILYS